jgi:hypothetical protein
MKVKTFAEKIKTNFNKLISYLRKKHESGKYSGEYKDYTIKNNGIEAEVNEGQMFFHPEYIGIYVRFTANNEYLFTAKIMSYQSVEEIEKIIKEEMTRRKNEFSNVINALNECLN